jgi:hypothetical protein
MLVRLEKEVNILTILNGIKVVWIPIRVSINGIVQNYGLGVSLGELRLISWRLEKHSGILNANHLVQVSLYMRLLVYLMQGLGLRSAALRITLFD